MPSKEATTYTQSHMLLTATPAVNTLKTRKKRSRNQENEKLMNWIFIGIILLMSVAFAIGCYFLCKY